MFTNRYWLFSLILCCLPLGGCATHAGTGATIGGLTGAAAGGLIGSKGGNALPGALIGGALGAGAGGLIGHTQDKIEDRHKQQMAAVTPSGMTVTNVINLTQQGHSDEVIINQIHTTRSVFQLSEGDLGTLKQYNVSERVIQAMQDTIRQQVVYRERPIIVRQPPAVVYVREVPPPPPPVVPVGFHFRYSSRR
jgi:hypothetical protein